MLTSHQACLKLKCHVCLQIDLVVPYTVTALLVQACTNASGHKHSFQVHYGLEQSPLQPVYNDKTGQAQVTIHSNITVRSGDERICLYL